jgi:uncharacterized protein YjbJ (UPF0337 family)
MANKDGAMDPTEDWNATNWSEQLADEGRWQQVRGRIRQTWGSITDDELDSARGSWERLVGAIKEKTGEAAETVEDKLRNFFR